ncbi:MAG: response regulator [Candidatus Omnitrophica bacterium]|nr:response regulator [Candidatus Omnitrophota bacterium]
MANEKILFADDEDNVVILMRRRLEKSGFQVLTASNGVEAFDILKKENPQLVILDQMMPQMSGLELCRKMKSEEKFKNIPVIIYTASTKKGLEEEVIHSGATGIIYKPMVVELVQLAKKILKGESIDWNEYQPPWTAEGN